MSGKVGRVQAWCRELLGPLGFVAYARSLGVHGFEPAADDTVGWEVNFSGMNIFALFVQVAVFQR